MQDHKRIFRIFQLISRMKSPVGINKQRVAADFEVSVRTIERYLELLKDVGFEIEKVSGRYRITSNKRMIDPHELVVFSAEEAATVRDAMMNTSGSGPLRKSVLEKLYALTEMDDIGNTLLHQHISRNLSNIRKCMRDKTCVQLVDYHSVNSKSITTRTVEPIRFYDYFKYLLAYEEASGEVRQFKVGRIGDARKTRKNWKYEDQHYTSGIDVFAMSGELPVKVVLDLSLRAQKLLVEEFPSSEKSIKPNGKLFRFSGTVNGLDAVGRFVGGLIDEIKIIEPPELVEHIQENFKKFQSRHHSS